MKTINRAVAIIKPKQLYIDWANSFDDGGPTLTLEEARNDATAYLIDEADTRNDLQKYVEKHYSQIFGEELASWMNNPKLWPKKRTLKMFKEWFDVESFEMVCDLSKKSLAVDG